jgi:hypothetical protein
MASCTQHEYAMDFLKEFAFRDAFRCSVEAGFSGPTVLFATLILAGVGLSLYIVSDDIILPWAAMVATSGVFLPLLTSWAITVFVVVILVVGGGVAVVGVRKLTPRA